MEREEEREEDEDGGWGGETRAWKEGMRLPRLTDKEMNKGGGEEGRQQKFDIGWV